MFEVEHLLSEENDYISNPENFCEICKDHFHPTAVIDVVMNKTGGFTCSHQLENMTVTNYNINQVRVTLQCGHKYHYECISKHFFYSKNRHCPYCRQESDYIPLLPGLNVVKHVHREYLKQNNRCCVILKTGKKRGEVCGSKTFGNLTTCRRHASKLSS